MPRESTEHQESRNSDLPPLSNSIETESDDDPSSEEHTGTRSQALLVAQKKEASCSSRRIVDDLDTNPNDESAIDDDDDWKDIPDGSIVGTSGTDPNDESAIADDDDWKDIFRRRDPLPTRSSCPSMVAVGIAKQHSVKLGSGPPLTAPRKRHFNRPSMPKATKCVRGTTKKNVDPSPLEIVRVSAQPIPPVSSPRTTRRKMLSTELPPSLRKNILQERKPTTTVLNPHETSHVDRNQKQQPSMNEHSGGDIAGMDWQKIYDHPLGW